MSRLLAMMLHHRDAERFRPGLGGAARYFKDDAGDDAQPPGDADGAGAGDTDDGAAGAGEEDAGEKGAKGAADDKGEKKQPEKKADEKGAKDKGDAKGKAEGEKKPDAKKTLLARSKDPKAGDDKANGKSQDKDGNAGADELEAWTPTLPKGQKLDNELLGEAKTWAKAHGLKGEQLQGVVDLGVKLQEKAVQGLVAAHEKAIEANEAAARADKEIGGAKLDQAVQNGLAALKRFAGADFDPIVDELERTGMGSHPAVIKLLNKIHEATKEDDTAARVRGSAAPPTGKSFAQKMYGKSLEQGMQDPDAAKAG